MTLQKLRGRDAKMAIKFILQIAPAILALLLSLQLQKMEKKRRRHEENMSEYLYNLTNCLITTVDSVLDIAEQVAVAKNNCKLDDAVITLKKAQRDLSRFQQKMAAKLISGG